MSWSVSAIGKPAAVAEKLAAEFVKYKCLEPEETIKSHVANAVAAALAAFPLNSVVEVSASGSQSRAETGPPVLATNQLTVTIKPIFGFVE